MANPNPRPSVSKPPPPPTKSAQTTLVHPLASLTGTHPIELGHNVIIQLRSRLNAVYGPLKIGTGAIVSERASVGYLSPPDLQSSDQAGTVLGEGVTIESGATVEAASMGSYTTVGIGAKVGKGAVIGAHCTVCAKVEIAEGETVGDGTVIWGNGWGERRQIGSLQVKGVGRKEMVEGLGVSLRSVWSPK